MPARARLLPLLLLGALPVALAFLGAPACTRQRPPSTASAGSGFTLAGELIFNPAPDATGLRFGGLSGMVSLGDGREMLAISDDSESPRVLRLRVTDTPAWSVHQLGSIRLQSDSNAPARLDPEGIALTAEGHILISSEGISTAAVRLPPSITEYSADGAYVRQLQVRARFVQNPVGTLTTGVRPNAGFESLTTTPDFAQLFTAAEVSLLQDGDGDPFSAAPRTRMLEYVQRSDGYQPAREFVYELDPLPRPIFRVGFAVNGLVELLALSNSELLALERAFVESEDKSTTINRIRLFRISLDAATDVAGIDSLSNAGPLRPVSKVLLSDLNALPGLSARLANLDNFEGLAWGPRDRNGVRPLIVVSDDNFNTSQMTAFLFLQPGRAASVR